MILPNIRASFGSEELELVLDLLAAGDTGARAELSQRAMRNGFDALLDDPRTLNAFMATDSMSGGAPRLAFYLLVRHVLLEHGIGDRELADYLAAVLYAFGRGSRAEKAGEGDGERFVYLVDMVRAIDSADDERAFLLCVHLGNYALWLSGLFPEHITARVQRRGAPGIRYYEELGATGYRLAADTADAEAHGLNQIYKTCADAFPSLRVALNHVSDRYLFPCAGDPIERLLRQVADEYRYRSEPRTDHD